MVCCGKRVTMLSWFLPKLQILNHILLPLLKMKVGLLMILLDCNSHHRPKLLYKGLTNPSHLEFFFLLFESLARSLYLLDLLFSLYSNKESKNSSQRHFGSLRTSWLYLQPREDLFPQHFRGQNRKPSAYHR